MGCDADCRVSPESVAAAVTAETVLVSVMFVNNETGAVQDVAGIADAVHRRNPRTLIHTDAVQAFGRIPFHPAELGVDLLSLSAHKIYGPKGVGALWVRHGVALAAQSTGGGQERNRRSATENVAGIVGFAAAAELAERVRAEETDRQAALCQRLVAAVEAQVPGALVTAAGAAKAAGFATFAIAGVRSDVLLAALDMDGVDASAGSACGSGAPLPSHVLRAMGYPDDLAAGALRCTTGRSTTVEDIDRAASLITAAVEQIRDRLAAARSCPGRLTSPVRPERASPIAARSAVASPRRRGQQRDDLLLKGGDHRDRRGGRRLLEELLDRRVVAEQMGGVGGGAAAERDCSKRVVVGDGQPGAGC